jgi:chemotaxis response regulator CheB
VIRVLLLDGQPLIRMVLDGTPNLSVIAEAADGAQAVRLAVERSWTWC